MAKKTKPRGFGKFDKLTRMLVQVPRAELEERLANRHKRKPRKKK